MTAHPLGTPEDGPVAPPGAASDVELLCAIAAGSEAAFVELRGRYAGAVARVCRAVVGRDAEDCEQEVFVRIWRKAALFDRSRGSAAAWLLTVARRTALNLHAARRTDPPIEDEEHGGVIEPADVDAFWLDAALARLSERERSVIELVYYDDLSERAIARRLHVPLGSVKSWKRRGLNRLATLLAEESS
jgi:RNA polymerase sigma-70 factor (ECF subfamily)